MNIQSFNSHSFRYVAAFLAILSSGGCAHYSVDVRITDGNFKTKGTSIAIISGTKEPQNVTLAQMVSDSLRKKSRFQVASMAQISKSLEPYPQTIKGPYKSAYFYIDVEWDLADKQKIAAIQRSLGVDYLFIIWAPIRVSSNGNSVNNMPAVAQMFEPPNAKEVAKGVFNLFVGDEGSVFLKEGVEEISKQIVEETKMTPAAKK
jgi:hypothetical protein